MMPQRPARAGMKPSGARQPSRVLAKGERTALQRKLLQSQAQAPAHLRLQFQQLVPPWQSAAGSMPDRTTRRHHLSLAAEQGRLQQNLGCLLLPCVLMTSLLCPLPGLSASPWQSQCRCRRLNGQACDA